MRHIADHLWVASSFIFEKKAHFSIFSENDVSTYLIIFYADLPVRVSPEIWFDPTSDILVLKFVLVLVCI